MLLGFLSQKETSPVILAYEEAQVPGFFFGIDETGPQVRVVVCSCYLASTLALSCRDPFCRAIVRNGMGKDCNSFIFVMAGSMAGIRF